MNQEGNSQAMSNIDLCHFHVPDALLDLSLRSRGNTLVSESVQRPQLVTISIQSPSRVRRIAVAEGQAVEGGDAVLVQLRSHLAGEGVADLLHSRGHEADGRQVFS